MRQRHTTPHRFELLAQRAGRMRFEATTSERLLWLHLRGSQLGVSFKRQGPMFERTKRARQHGGSPVRGRFIVDFLASSAKLAVEVDGPYHGRRALADASRDRALARLGYRVLRLDAELVVRDMVSALALVRAALPAGR